MFDLIAGTSTGGILALSLIKPGQDGKPDYSAKKLINNPAMCAYVEARKIRPEEDAGIRAYVPLTGAGKARPFFSKDEFPTSVSKLAAKRELL